MTKPTAVGGPSERLGSRLMNELLRRKLRLFGAQRTPRRRTSQPRLTYSRAWCSIEEGGSADQGS
jgi:hypothetical protein